MKKFITFGRPHFTNKEINEVTKTLKSGWWGTGPKTELFEKRFAAYVQAKYALAVSSCTAGLHLACQGIGVSPTAEIITTPLTFPATANVIINSGAKPVFVDINRETGLIDENQIEQKITAKTAAIMPVHLYGRPCHMDKIMAIARKHNLFVIEDAAHAVESWYHGKKIGTIGDISVFSFYVTKNMSTGEGGMITTNNKKWAEKMRVLSLHGLSRDAYKRYSTKHFSLYECLAPGYKYNMTDIQSSLGLHQLARLEKNWTIRNKQWNLYNSLLATVPGITTPPPEEKNTRHARHLYTIIIDKKKAGLDRGEFIQKLIKKNIGAGVHFYPVHLHEYYRKTFGYRRGDFPNAEYIGDRTVSLPLGPSYAIDDIRFIADTIIKICGARV